MPRAYSPNLRTVQRANAVATALGIKGWHLAKGPDLFWHGEGNYFIRRSLKFLEQTVAEQVEREWCLHHGSDTCEHAAQHNAAMGKEAN
jgi:hypothetical protein